MESEKVKEIKESLQQEIHLTEYVDSAYSENVSLDLLKDVLTLINELETENERLMKLQARGGCRVAELGIENQQLKDRIAELETENAIIKNSVAMRDYKTLEEMSNNKVKQFAERLKEELGSVDLIRGWAVKVFIDETLKEYE